jgi:GntR family uxuAB operon transcriptional repressor
MPLKALPQKRIYQQVAEQLADLISSGEFSVHERLPPERELAQTLKISRNVVREALLALEIAGYVDIRVGVGTFVVSNSARRARTESFASFDAGASPTDILTARRAVEGEVAAIAATEATDAEIKEIGEILEEIKKSGGAPSELVDLPRDFHERLAEATHNPVLIGIVQQLWDLTRGELFENIRHHTRMQESHRRRQLYRIRLLDRLKSRDANGAREAMHAHLDEVTSCIFDDDVT